MSDTNKHYMKFQKLQSDLAKYIDEDVVTIIAIGIANTDLTEDEKCNVLKSIINANKPK